MTISVPYGSWIETANAAAGLATATRASSAGSAAHYITSIAASYSATDDGLLTLKQGATEIGRWYVYDAFALVFPNPVRIEPGNPAELQLAAGTGTGAVTMTGFTL